MSLLARSSSPPAAALSTSTTSTSEAVGSRTASAADGGPAGFGCCVEAHPRTADRPRRHPAQREVPVLGRQVEVVVARQQPHGQREEPVGDALPGATVPLFRITAALGDEAGDPARVDAEEA